MRASNIERRRLQSTSKIQKLIKVDEVMIMDLTESYRLMDSVSKYKILELESCVKIKEEMNQTQFTTWINTKIV